MIIVSQDRNRIINFNNILQLYISRCQKEEITEYYIRYEDCNNSYEDIGTYKTEEIAKEVLGEIIKMKSVFEYFKNVPEHTQSLLAGKFIKDNVMFDTYEMPEK